MSQLGIPSRIWCKGEAVGREVQRSSQQPGKKVCCAHSVFASKAEQHLHRLKKKWAQRVLYTESSGPWQAVGEDEAQADQLCWRQDRMLSCRPEMRSEVVGSGKGQEKRWWWEGDFNFCSSQTACKLTAGHPGVRQGDRLSLSLGHTETGL